MTDQGIRQSEPVFAPLWALVASLILALVLAGAIARTAPDLDKVALGDQTRAVYGNYRSDRIFCGWVEQLPQCLGPAKARALSRRIVWFGNSQLHAINQFRPGDRTAPVLLAEALRPVGSEVQAFSLPNASLAELLIMASVYQQDRRPDILVMPLFLDDMRERSVRGLLRPALALPGVKADLERSEAGRAAIAALPAPTESEKPKATLSMQERSEEALTAALQSCCDFQETREKARGQIAIWSILSRNWIFGIDAQTIRPILPDAYRQNMTALEDILTRARTAKTRVILYIPPLRQDFRPPYDMAEYARFKRDTKALAEAQGAEWLDLDAIVPGPLWGTKASTTIGGAPELDFMHFQAPGHVAVKERIAQAIEAGAK